MKRLARRGKKWRKGRLGPSLSRQELGSLLLTNIN